MIWLKRLFNGPLLLKLRWDHCVLQVKIEQAQKNLFSMIEKYGYKNSNRQTKYLESLLEQISDLDERMSKLW